MNDERRTQYFIVHRSDFIVLSESARDVILRLLLLPAGESQGTAGQPVSYFVPQRAFLERFFDDSLERVSILDPLQPRTKRDVVVDALGKRIGLLEDQSHLSPQRHQVDPGCVDVLPGDRDLAGDPA